jgi:hypothetical protein
MNTFPASNIFDVITQNTSTNVPMYVCTYMKTWVIMYVDTTVSSTARLTYFTHLVVQQMSKKMFVFSSCFLSAFSCFSTHTLMNVCRLVTP